MANTVTTLSYANTFGQWLAATDALIAENNVLATNNYVKDSGTIYLSEGTLTALHSNGNVIVQKALMVQGVGSYASIQNDLTVERQGLFTNTELSIVASGSVEVDEALTIHGAGNGLNVDNDALINGNLQVNGDAEVGVLQARDEVIAPGINVSGITYTNKLQSNNEILTNILTSNNSIYTGNLRSNNVVITSAVQANSTVNTQSISATAGIFGNTLQANSTVNTANASIVHTVYSNRLQANSSVNTSNASIVNTVYTKDLVANATITVPTAYVTSNGYVNENLYVTQSAYAYDTYTTNTAYSDLFYANTVYLQNNLVTVGNTNSTSFFAFANVTTPTLYSTYTYGDYITANLHIYTTAIDVEGTTLTRYLQANSSTNTSNSSVVNTSWTKYLIANTLVTTAGLAVTGKTHTNTLQANTSANTETLSVTQRALIDQVQANTSVNTEILSVSTTTLTDKLQANSSVNTAVISVTGNTYTNRVQSNVSVNTASISVTQKVDGNTASFFANNLQVLNQFSVDGDFVINGTTIYNSNEFTLNAGSNEGQISSIIVNRGQTGANAEIRWNESNEWWDIYETNSGNYFRILTDEHISDVLDSTNPLVVASSLAANTLNENINTANTFLQGRITSAASFANGAFLRANASYTSQNTTAAFANSAYAHANAAYASANNVAPQVAPAYNQANAAFNKANSVVSSITGTTGTVSASSAGITLKSNNGIVIFATNDNGTGNTFAINTPQDVRTSASPTFAGLSLTSPLGVSQGGTGGTSLTSLFNSAITAAAGTGTSGQVLVTGGAGNYYWGASSGGGGGGAQPGTRISSSRLTYTGDSTQAKFTTPTFSAGTQLRAYINGVRQSESEYSSFTSNSIIWFTTPPITGDNILIEVDGYTTYEYYANNIVYGPPTGSMSGATIQDAIDDLESRKMPKVGGTFTGRVDGLTMPITSSNTVFATTAYVNNLANSSYTFTHSITGNAGTVTNGLYSSVSYSDPSWLTSLATSKLSGTIGNSNLIDTGVTAATHGTASSIPKFVVDAKGRITSVTNTAIQIATSQITGYPTFATSATTDTTNATNITSGTLANARLSDQAGLTAGSYGGNNKVGTFTVNAKGVITAASDQQISITKSQVSDFPVLATSATTDTTNASNITSGTLPEARLPGVFAKTTGATFSGAVGVSGTGTISLATNGDITATRSGGTTGVVFLNAAQSRYLSWDGTNYILPGAPLLVNGATVLDTAGTYTITGGRNQTSSNATGYANQAGTFAIYGNSGSAGTNHATMSFHRPGAYAINMGLDNDNVFRIGGWSAAANRFQMDMSGNLTMAGNVTAYSDARLKTNIQTIENALDKVLKMRGVSYERIDNGEKNIGVIAQEIKEVLPEVVLEREGDDQFMSVSYGNIVGVLIEAIKELKAEIEELKGQNK